MSGFALSLGDVPWGTTVLLTFAIGFGAATALAVVFDLRRLDRIKGDRIADAKAANARQLDIYALVDAVPEPIAQLDQAGEPTWMNRAYAALLPAGGTSRRPLVLDSRASAESPGAIEEELLTQTGRRRFTWTDVDAVASDGRSFVVRSGRETTGSAVSEAALSEARSRAEAASEAKSRFLATVTHEFRTPLNGILGMSDLLRETPLDPEQTAYVQALRGSGEALMSLVEEILDFSRIEAGRIDLVAEPFELEPLVQGVVELLAPRAQDKGVEISAFVSADVPRQVTGDRDRVRQILFNLAGNAVKFTERGGVGLSVGLSTGPDGAGGVVFAVADTGPGIPEDRFGSIFAEFEQDGERTLRGAGTGLGLAITRRIVDRMGGRIGLDSTVGQGSTFQVTLPLPPAQDGVADGPPEPVTGRRNVLIVADSAFEAGFLARRIAETGSRATLARTAQDALARMEADRFDVLIVDAALGELGARTVAHGTRLGVERAILLLSPFERRSFGSPHAPGFDAYLMKPVRRRSLLERIGLVPVDCVRPGAPAAPRMPRATMFAPPRVLLAEDNPVNALLAMKSLEKLGALVTWAKDGDEALRRADAAIQDKTPPFDLILMDMRMPGLDGAEVTQRIRERETAAGRDERCRIVALTASVGARERYRDTAGFDGFLLKPFTLDELAEWLPVRQDDYAKAS